MTSNVKPLRPRQRPPAGGPIDAHRRPATYDRRISLVLQGGGALGSYQAGVYEALEEADYAPDWVAGISIGAINGALIAGNPPGKRVEALQSFWRRVIQPAFSNPFIPGMLLSNCSWSAVNAILFGQDGLYAPRPITEWFGSPVSVYDTGALKSTLESLVDFDRINGGTTRLSVGAAHIETGAFRYFDSVEIPLRPEHIMASAALPPAFPPVEIDGQHYWDGGIVSNTPLQYVIDYVPRRSRLTFQVDLFNEFGPVPTDLDSALEREKDIRYSSRTRTATDMYRVIHDVRHNINTLIEKLPPDLRVSPEAQFLYEFGCVTRMDIVRVCNRPPRRQGHAKDYAFGVADMEERWARGYADARTTLTASPWLEPMPDELGARVFDLGATGVERPQTSLVGLRAED